MLIYNWHFLVFYKGYKWWEVVQACMNSKSNSVKGEFREIKLSDTTVSRGAVNYLGRRLVTRPPLSLHIASV